MSQTESTLQHAQSTHLELRPRRDSRWLQTVPHLIKGCFLVIVLIVLAALFAPVITRHDPSFQTLTARLQAPAGFDGGSREHILGTDQLGRDMFARVVYGSRVSLGIGLIGTLIGATIGITLGMIAGYRRGALDEAVMFLVDAQLALPTIVLALIAISIFGTGLVVLIAVVGIAGWESYARLTRGMVLSSREHQYVLAARAAGATRSRVMTRHILPNISAPLTVLATFQLTAIILLESSLSFLGIGVQPPTPSWGSMIGQGRDYLATAWWIAVAPGVAIVMTTMAISLIGDWLRDVMDPTLRFR